jgi:hypothetical protein
VINNLIAPKPQNEKIQISYRNSIKVPTQLEADFSCCLFFSENFQLTNMKGLILVISLFAAASAFPTFLDSSAFAGFENFDASSFIDQLTEQLQKHLEEANAVSEEVAVPYVTDEPEAMPYTDGEPSIMPASDEPEAVPYTDEPEAVPYQGEEDMSKPEHMPQAEEDMNMPEHMPLDMIATEEPIFVPYTDGEPSIMPASDEPEAVPYTDEPEAVPYSDQPEAVPYQGEEDMNMPEHMPQAEEDMNMPEHMPLDMIATEEPIFVPYTDEPEAVPYSDQPEAVPY